MCILTQNGMGAFSKGSMEGDNSGNFFSNKKAAANDWKSILATLWKQHLGCFQKKTSVAHTNQNKLWSCRGLSTWFALESSSSTQVPWPVDQLTKAIVGIKLTSGSRSFQHLPCWFWNLEFLSSIWGLHGFTSWVWWMERIARKHGCQDASFYQTTSQLIIFINISTFVFLTKSSFETQIPKKSIPSSRCCFSWTKL